MDKAVDGEPQSDTETDIAVGVMALQAARFGKKRADDEREVQAYRRRMNAASDAQAKRFGAEGLEQPVAEEDMQVYTNSPIVHTTRNPGPPAWLMTAIGAAALAGGVWLGGWLLQPAEVVPTPTPVSSGGDLHIQVIKP